MKIRVYDTLAELGAASAKQAAAIMSAAIQDRGCARIILSTGASQFPFFDALAEYPIDWSKVEVFHLDEYIGIGADHKASFQKYLRERFVEKLNPGKMHYISGEGDVAATIAAITAEVTKAPVDLGMIGIGENGHLAFNDPPADFDTQASFIVVTLNDTCKAQQVREGWFPSPEEMPPTAITMTVSQILKCTTIISVMPYPVKAEAIYQTVRQDVNNMLPATKLKEHSDVTIYLDKDSAAKLSAEDLARFA
jgi:glucosamine-6-phosphate deaminase